MQTYRTIRRYYNWKIRARILGRGLTLEQAQAHCADINTSSTTCWTTSARKRTKRYGPWFDSYERED